MSTLAEMQAFFNQGLLDLRKLDHKPAEFVMVEMAERYGIPGKTYGESSHDFRLRLISFIESKLSELNEVIGSK